MESYDEFIQKQIRQIKGNAHVETSEPASSPQPSNIRFYGVPVLPPLLNKDQKEEMQRLRESATHLMNKWKCSSSSRVSYVQNILNSVQLRNAPTFEDFKDERPATDECDETAESHWILPVFPAAPQITDEKAHISLSQPMTSTACDGHAVLRLRPLEGEYSLENSHTTVLFEGVPLVGHKPEQSLDLGTDNALNTHSLSQSYKNPHIDVSQQGLSSGYVTIEPSDVSSGWIVGDEGMEERHSFQSGFFLNTSNSTSIISHAPVDGEVLEEEHTLSNQEHPEVKEPVNAALGTEPSEEGPYRMSLQNLLKKSQEHRRHQRMLRNQALKALKVSEAPVVEECSLSDKENEEFFPGGTVKAELRRIRERKREQLPEIKVPSLEIQIQNHGTGRDNLKPPDLVSDVEDVNPPKCEVPLDHCFNITSSSNTAGSVTEKPLPTLSSYPSMADSPNQSTSATASPSAKSLYQSKTKKAGSLLPRPCQAAGKKFNNVPTPKFCLSPVRSKKGSGISGSFRKPLVKTPVCVDAEAGPNLCGQAKWASSLSAEPEGDDPACRSTDQAEQIAQLELNLSSLKVLISDLESTLSKSMADFNPTDLAEDHNSSQLTLLAEHESISLPASDGKPPSVVTFNETVQQDVFSKDNRTRPGSKQQELPHCVTSMVQRRRVPEVFRVISNSKRLSQRTAVLTDASNQPEEKRNASGEKKKELESIEDSLNSSSLNRSYDVDTPSRFWSQAGPKGKQLTPELGGQEGVSRAKRRLLMNNMDGTEIGQLMNDGRPQFSTPKAVSPWPEQQLRQEQEVQVRALMEEQHRQQKELLQSLATRYQFLRSVSFPCPSVGSRLEDVATSLPPSSVSMGLGSSSQPSELTLAELSVLSDSLHISQSQSCLPVCHRPLVAAAVKGYLTRRLLRTERVAQLIRTIKDTQLFLQDFQCQTPGREFSSRQDRVLQERVTLQLQSARYELHDLFFSLCPADRMQVISWDRQLAREREFRHKENKEPQAGRKSTLSAATRKALERKRTVMLQKKAAERSKVALGTEDGWTFVPNPRRVPKKATPLRGPR
uniref:Centriolar coiled-coil protein 110 n=1 Tax=Astyanax mexicanus TaxID=7994 RepID=W5LMB2_ASTMX